MPRLNTLKPRIPTLGARLPTVLRTERMRGRAAVDRRARWLQEHPLCAECEQQGRVTAATVVDHKAPLWAGGADDYEVNGQSLCRDHHDQKTKLEAAERARGA